MNTIKKLPIPFAGTILGLFAMGNLFKPYHPNFRLCFGILGAILWILFTIRLIAKSGTFQEEMQNPVIASVFGTYSMATMLFASYVLPYQKTVGMLLFFLGFILHVILILWFTQKFTMKKDLSLVFPSWYIVYVGIVVASVVGKAFGLSYIPTISFYFGLVTYILLIPAVVKRVKTKPLPDPLRPTLAILTAPGGLLLAGYANCIEKKIVPFSIGLMIVSAIFYLYVIGILPSVFAMKPVPSISGITFPTVITAMGIKLNMVYLCKTNGAIPGTGLKTLFLVLDGIALICVFYALVQYGKILFAKKEK